MSLKLEVNPDQQKVTTTPLGEGSRLGVFLHQVCIGLGLRREIVRHHEWLATCHQ